MVITTDKYYLNVKLADGSEIEYDLNNLQVSALWNNNEAGKILFSYTKGNLDGIFHSNKFFSIDILKVNNENHYVVKRKGDKDYVTLVTFEDDNIKRINMMELNVPSSQSLDLSYLTSQNDNTPLLKSITDSLGKKTTFDYRYPNKDVAQVDTLTVTNKNDSKIFKKVEFAYSDIIYTGHGIPGIEIVEGEDAMVKQTDASVAYSVTATTKSLSGEASLRQQMWTYNRFHLLKEAVDKWADSSNTLSTVSETTLDHFDRDGADITGQPNWYAEVNKEITLSGYGDSKQNKKYVIYNFIEETARAGRFENKTTSFFKKHNNIPEYTQESVQTESTIYYKGSGEPGLCPANHINRGFFVKQRHL